MQAILEAARFVTRIDGKNAAAAVFPGNIRMRGHFPSIVGSPATFRS